ncbi:MAG: hypothetical protein AAGA20_24555, partial [Planctomycetota bacterium]
ALGALAGLSLWFHYGLAVWLAAMLLVELCRDRAAWFRPSMGVRVAGLIAGLLPWWIYNATHDWLGLGVYGKSAAGHFQTGGEAVTETFTRLVTHFLPHSLYLPEMGGVGPILEGVLFVCALAAWGIVSFGAVRALARERSVRPELVLALYPPIWTVLYTFGTFHGQDWWVSGYRYMLPLHPIAWISSGIVLARAAATARIAVVASLLALFSITTATYLRPDHVRINATAPGHNTESIGRFLFLRAGEDPERLLGAVDRLVDTRDPLTADVVLFTLGNCLLFGATVVPPPKIQDPERRAAIEATARNHRESLRILEDAVESRFKPYFSELRKDERAYKWPDRRRFWEQWDRRGEPRPSGAYAH